MVRNETMRSTDSDMNAVLTFPDLAEQIPLVGRSDAGVLSNAVPGPELRACQGRSGVWSTDGA